MKRVVYCCPRCRQRMLLTRAEDMPTPGEPTCARCGFGMVAVTSPRRPFPQHAVAPQPLTAAAP